MTDPPPAPESETADVAALRRENAILRQVLDAIDGTIVVYDAERRFVLSNKAYHDYFPHLPPDHVLVGQRYEALLERSIDAGASVDPSAKTDRAAFIARRIQEIEQRRVPAREIQDTTNGKWYMVRVSHTPDGHRVALRVDITEQKRLQAELDQARAEAERVSAAKSQFLANVSHELRTPLNAIINFARLLLDEPLGALGAPEYRNYATDIHDSGRHLLALIQDLLDFASADAGRLTTLRQPVNLRALIESVVRLLQPAAADAHVSVVAVVPDDLPAVAGDNTRLRQVLFNLLDNAIKYAGPGSRIRISAARCEDGGLELVVADDGTGIAAEDLARVLLPFEQAIPLGGGHRSGIGLGLPLAMRLVHLHEGTLTLESTQGQGTSVRIHLPAARVLT
ncbi:MAG: PAS-domain containing protein [Rhodospirillales bacterium]|nr:PAS-domain containing protein [Rhodospirillales bacterium]